MGARSGGLAPLLVLAVDLGSFNLRCIRFEPRRIAAAPHDVLSLGDQYRFLEAPSFPRVFKTEVPYSKLVPEAVALRLRMVGTNEGGVLPAGCERLFAALEDNAESTLRVASGRFVAQRTEGVTWTEVPGALPRVRWLPAASLAELSRPIKEIDVSGGSEVAASSQGARIDLLVDESRRIVVRTDSDSGGVLLIADTWYAGWSCTVDEALSEIMRAYGCFRAVRVPKGRHIVEMRYQPRSFHVGAGLSVTGLCLLLAPWLLRFNRRVVGLWASSRCREQ
jgi:hypothetical protein